MVNCKKLEDKIGYKRNTVLFRCKKRTHSLLGQILLLSNYYIMKKKWTLITNSITVWK